MNRAKNIFQSRPFYYKYNPKENLHRYLANKLVWLLFLCIIMFVLFVITIGIGYQPKYIDANVLPSNNGQPNSGQTSYDPQPLPQNIRTFRAVSLFFLAWFIVFSAWLIKLGINMIQQNQKRFGIWYCLSFIFGWNIGLWIYELIKLDKLEFKEYVRQWFAIDQYYYERPFIRTSCYWLALISLIITSPIIWFSLFRNPDLNTINCQVGYKTNLWFSSLQYFTIETNLMCYIALVIYVINPRWKLFKNNDVIIALCAYIVIVSITFNFGIFPFSFQSKYANKPYKITRTVFEHIINPVFYTTTFIMIFYQNNRGYNDYLTNLKYSLIVPTIYGGYVLLTPIMCGNSVYSVLTNTNPNLILGNHKGTYAAFLVYLGFLLIFVGFLTLFWWLNYFFWQKQNKVIKYNLY